MGESNTSNPFATRESEVQSAVPMPAAKAKVVGTRSSTENGLHTVTIKVYGDGAQYRAPVLTTMLGSANVPAEGDDVLVVFASKNKPWVIGSWYAFDRIEDGSVNFPEYKPGEVVIGHRFSDSYMKIHRNGDLEFQADGNLLGDVSGKSEEDVMDIVAGFLSPRTLLTATYDDENDTYYIDVEEGSISHDGIDQTTVSPDDHHPQIDAQEDGVSVVDGPSSLNFANALNVSNPSAGEAKVDVDESAISTGAQFDTFTTSGATATTPNDTSFTEVDQLSIGVQAGDILIVSGYVVGEGDSGGQIENLRMRIQGNGTTIAYEGTQPDGNIATGAPSATGIYSVSAADSTFLVELDAATSAGSESGSTSVNDSALQVLRIRP